MVQEVVLSNSQFLELINSINNLAQGLKFLMYIAAAFFVWKVIKVLYSLFGGIFFGGV